MVSHAQRLHRTPLAYRLIVVRPGAIAPLLNERLEIADKLGGVLATRRAVGPGRIRGSDDDVDMTTLADQIQNRIRNLFRLWRVCAARRTKIYDLLPTRLTSSSFNHALGNPDKSCGYSGLGAFTTGRSF